MQKPKYLNGTAATLQALADDRGGGFITYKRDTDGKHMARIEWLGDDRRARGGEDVADSEEAACCNLLLWLQEQGLA